jgi:hypothetical protein
MFISRDKFLAKFTNYRDQFIEQKNKQIKNFLQSTQAPADGENAEMKVEEEPKELTRAQEQMIENEVHRKLRKDRGLDGGVKLVREKVPFIF